MKKIFFVIGNPIEHSLSPKLHGYWIKKNNINASYEKKLIEKNQIKKLILDIREEKIHGINVTLPFKKVVIPFLDVLSDEARKSQSVNTIYKSKEKIVGDNTDIEGFESGLKATKQIIKNKRVLILGAGGVVPSIIMGLKKLEIGKIFLSNRTESRALELKNLFPEVEVLKWGMLVDFDIIINATSIGLNEKNEIKINYEKVSNNKFFYDIIYNPEKTIFLKKAKKFGGYVENGKMMFIYQAQKAFFIWHGILPEVDSETINLLSS